MATCGAGNFLTSVADVTCEFKALHPVALLGSLALRHAGVNPNLLLAQRTALSRTYGKETKANNRKNRWR
jgi:hypothetical protein